MKRVLWKSTFLSKQSELSMLVSQCVCVCFDYTTLSLGPDVPSSVFELEANLFHFMCFWIREKTERPERDALRAKPGSGWAPPVWVLNQGLPESEPSF